MYQHNLDLLCHWFCYSSSPDKSDLVTRVSHYLVLILAFPPLFLVHIWTRAYRSGYVQTDRGRKIKENIKAGQLWSRFFSANIS